MVACSQRRWQIAVFDLGAEDVESREVLRLEREFIVYGMTFVRGGTLLAVLFQKELCFYSIPLGGKVVFVRRPPPSTNYLRSCVRDTESDEWMILEGMSDAQKGMPEQRVFERWNRREAMGEQ